MACANTGPMEEKGAAEADCAPHPQGRAGLDLLSQQLPEDLLLGEALDADHKRFGGAATGTQPPTASPAQGNSGVSYSIP